MKKAISRTLCLIFIVIMIVPIASSCGKDKAIYSLGEYEITEKEYNYLFGMFKKKVLVSMGGDLSDEDMLQEISEGITLADYLEARYRDGFEQSVLALLLSQAIFDELGLSLTDEELSTINATATAMVAYFGNYSEKEFNNKAKDYGFDDDAMRSVYEMQFKENKVRDYYLGANNEKVTDENRESYYRENYLRYQTLIVNTLYKLHTDSYGDVSFVLLDEDEKKEKEQLVAELKELLINKNTDYDYILLKDDINLSYEELWEKYSDDKFYPAGLYETSQPSAEQLANSNVLSAAYQSRVGEIKTVTAKRYFEGDSSLENEEITVKPGDYFEYGTIFVKRLELDEAPYEKKVNKDFFDKDTFEAGVYNYVYFKAISAFQETLPYQATISRLIEGKGFATIKSNELDYYYFAGDLS